jgi:putative endonuclease
MAPTRKFIPASEWEDERQLRGLEGERLALAYLTSAGWSVEAHRWKMGRHDIDLIVRRGGIVAFVEVKSRRGASCGSPFEAIPRKKQSIIGRVAALWALRFGRRGDTYRFDAVAVHFHPGGRIELEHLEDAWRL